MGARVSQGYVLFVSAPTAPGTAVGKPAPLHASGPAQVPG